MLNNASLETLYLPFLAEQKVRQILVENIDKYPDEKWKTQTVQEHLEHLVAHVADYMSGDKGEDWLAKIVTRAAMAAWVSEQPACTNCNHIVSAHSNEGHNGPYDDCNSNCLVSGCDCENPR